MTTTTARAERLARARKELEARGLDALLLGPSADLRHLTGYQAPSLERMTLLVLPAAGDALGGQKLCIGRRKWQPVTEERLRGVRQVRR